MKQFQFKLASIQKLRERSRDEAADSLRQANLAKQKLSDQLESIQVEFAQQSQFQSKSSQGLIDHQRVLESQRFQMHLIAEANAVRQNIELIQQECDRRQQLLIHREQEVRALERLRDSQVEQWNYEQQLAQQATLDQWAGFRHWIELNNEGT